MKTLSGLVAVLAVLTGSLVWGAAPASAELVLLTSGRTLSVKSHRFDGDQVVLALRAGGEISCERSLVARIDPDEVPYPEPAPAAALAAAAPAPLDNRFRELIAETAARHRLEPRLLESVIRVESNFAHQARSRKGAMGLMQLMPATARQYAVRDPYDPASNLDAGARHLRDLLDRFELPVALAAYNAGEAVVRRFGGIPPYRETREYVSRILRLVRPPSPVAYISARPGAGTLGQRSGR